MVAYSCWRSLSQAGLWFDVMMWCGQNLAPRRQAERMQDERRQDVMMATQSENHYHIMTTMTYKWVLVVNYFF